jgi:hypothetical protein
MSPYTGKYYPSYPASKAAKQAPNDNSSACLNSLDCEHQASNAPILTVSDFGHAYRFILTTKQNTPVAVNKLIATYYSHIRLECIEYVLKYTLELNKQDRS